MRIPLEREWRLAAGGRWMGSCLASVVVMWTAFSTSSCAASSGTIRQGDGHEDASAGDDASTGDAEVLRDAGSGADAALVEDGTMPDAAAPCGRDWHVEQGTCAPCPAGSTNEPGDDPAGGDTFCDPVFCARNEHVVSHDCVPCPEGSTNDPGDDATGQDTSCDDYCSGADVVLREPLTTSASGQVRGGSFSSEGWATGSTSDQISWDLGRTLSSGSIEFEVRGFFHAVQGCFWGVCYYVGLFEEANGDKEADYQGSAFIESRYHSDQQENFHDTFKLQSGLGDGSMDEPMMPEGIGWTPDQWHRFAIEWGGGTARFFIDGQLELTSHYSNSRPVSWRYLFLGTTNYKQWDWGAVGVTYRNLCVRN